MHDIATIADFAVSEVIQIGEVLGVPHEVLYRTPSDGLSGMSDEDKLGVKYAEIEKYIEGEELPEEVSSKIERLHKSTRHKFSIPTYRREEN